MEEATPSFPKKKWLWTGLIIALLNPIFSGLILGVVFLSEPQLKKQGRIVLVVAVIWGALFFYLSNWLASHGYLPINVKP